MKTERVDRRPTKEGLAIGKLKPWDVFEYTIAGDKETESEYRLCIALPDWSRGRETYSLDYLELVGDGTKDTDEVRRYFVKKDPPDYVVNVKKRGDLRVKAVIDDGGIRFRVEPTKGSSDGKTKT